MHLRKLESRIKALEARHHPAKVRKSTFPAWLVEEWQKQGIGFDAAGLPDLVTWRSGLANEKHNSHAAL